MEWNPDHPETAAERSAPLIRSARKRGESALEAARDRAGTLASEAKSEAKRLAKR